MNTTTSTSFVSPAPASQTSVLPNEVNRFDVVKYLKLVGMELLNFVTLAVCFGMLLSPIFESLAIIVSNGNASAGWGKTICLFLSPLTYGLLIGKSGKDQIPRISIQLAWSILFGLLGMLLLSTSAISFASKMALAGVMLGAGCWLGSFVVKKPSAKSEKEDKPTTFASVFKSVAKTVFAIVIGFGSVIGVQYLNMHLTNKAQSVMYVDKVAPATVFETVDGDSWNLEESRGKVVVLEFWAPYCGPCVASMPWLKQLNDKYSQHDDFQMVGVSCGNHKRSISLFEKKEANWKLVFMPEESSEGDFKPTFIPMAYVIGRDGNVVAAGIHTSELEEHLERLFPAED